MINKKKLVTRARKAEWLGSQNPVDRMLISGIEKYKILRTSLRKVDDPNYSKLFLRSRNFKRNLAGDKYKFVTVDDATAWTYEWVQTFPRQYDLIIGVPRSGMLVASIIALRLGKGLATPELLTRGEFWHSAQVKGKLNIEDMEHVLLVDDSINDGRAMQKAFDEVSSAAQHLKITKAALIVKDESKHHADLYHKIVEPPRAFEWNILHQKIASYAACGTLAVDLDGVLCANLPVGCDDDEEWYLNCISNAKPYLIPSFHIDAIVTCRLEKYREHTEEWLKRHNVRYGELRMWDVPSKADRDSGFAAHKIRELLDIKPDLMWESSWSQSQRIWEETRIPTLCIDEMKMLN